MILGVSVGGVAEEGGWWWLFRDWEGVGRAVVLGGVGTVHWHKIILVVRFVRVGMDEKNLGVVETAGGNISRDSKAVKFDAKTRGNLVVESQSVRFKGISWGNHVTASKVVKLGESEECQVKGSRFVSLKGCKGVEVENCTNVTLVGLEGVSVRGRTGVTNDNYDKISVKRPRSTSTEFHLMEGAKQTAVKVGKIMLTTELEVFDREENWILFSDGTKLSVTKEGKGEEG